MPRTSVVIPYYNQRAYLRFAVSSALEAGASEVVVVDDGSTDGGIETIRDLPVIVLHLKKNFGQAHALNLGVEKSTGEWVTFLDADDILLSTGLKVRTQYLEKNPGVPVVAGRVAGVIDREGNVLGSFDAYFPYRFGPIPNQVDRKHLERGGQFPSFNWLLMHRREFLKSIGPFDSFYRSAHDNDFFYRVLAKTPLDVIDDGVVLYRIHDQNLSWHQETGRLRPRVLAENLFVKLQHGRL